MASGQLSTVIRFLHALVAPRADHEAMDRHLLKRFATQRDEAAFTALLQRHGPMVWGVCERVLRNSHDAEDAFQATFLVLVRKAGSVNPPELLGNWLYGVAYRTALKAKAEAAKRRAHERQVVDMAEGSASVDAVWADLRPVLDEEVSRLPDKYRVPVVLCYLQGRTNEEAARLLGCPKGTVLSRLARARERLRVRLTRRGLTLSVSAFPIALSTNAASATMPAGLMNSTIKVAMLAAMGKAAATGVISTKVAGLTEGVLKSMWLTKLKIAAAWLIVVAALGVGASGFGSRLMTGRASDPEQAIDQAAQAKEKKDKLDTAVEMLKANLDNFGFFVTFSGDDKEPYGTIELATHCSDKSKTPPHWLGCADLGREGAARVIEHLAASGFFDRATAIAMSDQDARVKFYTSTNKPCYSLQVSAAYKDPQYHEILGWDLKMLQRLDALRKVLDGDAAKLMDKLLLALEPMRKKWSKPEKKVQTSDWGEDSKGLQCRVVAPTEIEQGMPLEVQLELRSEPKKLEPGVKQLNAFLYPAFVDLVLTNRSTGKRLNVKPHDPTRGMRVDDRGTSVIPLDGTAPKPWSISFPLARLGSTLEPGSYDCAVEYSFPETPHQWWQGTGAEWAGFWHGTVRSGSFRLEVRKETPRKQTFSLPKTLRLENGRKVGYRSQDTENVTLPVRNGYIVGTRVYRNGQECRMESTPPVPYIDEPAPPTDQWSDDKKGGKKIEYTIEIFETADPPEHGWHPGPGSGGYKVLWKKTFTLSLTEEEIRKLQGAKVEALKVDETWQGRAGFKLTDDLARLAFSRDCKMVATAGGKRDPTVRVWDTETGKVRASFDPGSRVGRLIVSVAFAPDGKVLATGSGDGVITLWDLTTEKAQISIQGHTGQVLSVALSADGTQLASTSRDGTVKLWECVTGKAIATLTGHASYFFSVAFSPGGKMLAAGGEDGTVSLWDAVKRKQRTRLKGHSGQRVAFSPDGRLLVMPQVYEVAFSPDGKMLATKSLDNTAKLWDVATGQELATPWGDRAKVSTVAFAPDGKTLATGSEDGTAVKIWDTTTRKEQATLSVFKDGVRSVSFAPDGKKLAAGGAGGIKLWELRQ